jgi:hydroxymethylpyrimidine/phosphomethylpyrimidine kinase
MAGKAIRATPISICGQSSTGHWLAHQVDDAVQARAARVRTRNTHGTGCTLSSAIAARLAQGAPLREAVAVAKRYVTGALRGANSLRIGHGAGPVHHFHSWWEPGP